MNGQSPATPWSALYDAGWRICGMNHYNLHGQPHLFCCIEKEGRCLIAESTDEAEVFSKLARLSGLAETPAEMPWSRLFADGWRICSANHLASSFYCSMTRKNSCVRAERKNDTEVFAALETLAVTEQG